jgi:hypothetical protein
MAFMEQVGYELADYSVALGYFANATAIRPRIYGSGVLVRKGLRHGILTAAHCVDDLRLGIIYGDRLCLTLKRSNWSIVPPEVIRKHVLAQPKPNHYEPDLAFLEILPSPQLSSIKSKSSFYPLDNDYRKIKKSFCKVGRSFVVIGFPGEYHQTLVDGKRTRQIVKHMTFLYYVKPDSISVRNGWDYIEAKNWYGKKSELPKSFAGVSGGPAWGLQVGRDENGNLKLEKSALIGIAFLQEFNAKGQPHRVRCHCVRSIYDVAWRNLQ